MIAALYSGVAVLILPLGFVAPKGEAVLFTLAAIAALIAVWRQGRASDVRWNTRLVAALAVFLALAAVSTAWSISPLGTAGGTAILAATVAGALVLAGSAATLTAPERVRIDTVVLYGVGFALLWLAVDLLSGGAIAAVVRELKRAPINPADDARAYLTNGASIAAVAAWPWLAVIVRRFGWRAGVAALGAVFVVACLGRAATTPIALALGGIFAAAAVWRPAVCRRIALVLVVGATLAAPLLPRMLPDPQADDSIASQLSNSALHRMVIWRNAEALIRERPWLGYGFDSTRALYGPGDKREYRLSGRSWAVTSEPIPSHTHNASLQVWLELGAFGGLALAGVLVALITGLFRRFQDPLSRFAAAGAFVTTLVIANLSYGAWQSWWLGGAALAIVLLFAVTAGGPGRDRAWIDRAGHPPI